MSDADSLAAWLDEQVALTVRLDALLAAERSALLNREPERLQALARDKDAQLRALDAAASALAARLGISLDADAIGHWLTATATPAQRSAWSRFESGLEQCRRANEANGALLGARFAQIESSLRYLREAVGGVVYGASGNQVLPASGGPIARA